ncbi:peptidoglycan DD-metalloendopeptidase family protein [Pseudomonas sp. PSKL.D1]|uniref:peptidoglycan DD-metalloendopeptidase family protein n=1 Tax=Pseudomonas sp. PSKL.D1 TaxID=3029060 RepID=UPI00238144E2|nr:peptidoglycan DD-metalloendopeptidase family protein [Pseudomonas sp. PSKL.D1]WDY58003.1 peptidoglycan DD-metalloendopeptidase family protein [Pseudomonas sp. PSKL.D1]
MPAAARLLLCCALLSASVSSFGMTLYRTTDDFGVVSYSDRPSPGAKTFTLREPMLERVDGQVRLQTEPFPGGVRFFVRNDLYVPMEVELRIDKLANAFGGNAPRIVRSVVGPRSTKVLSSVLAAPGGPLKYASKFQYAMGDPVQRSQGYRYPFPWKGGPFRLTQGPNGRFSHFGAKGRYAMDIAMPEGTPIIAARAGVVVKIENNQTGRGTNPAGNFVRILHPDGTMGVYLHLMRGSVVVREGQQVGLGQALAKSGNTGNSTGPHLHFVVQRNVGFALESIPFQFDRPIGGLPDFTAGNP